MLGLGGVVRVRLTGGGRAEERMDREVAVNPSHAHPLLSPTAALIVGGVVGIVFAVFLILLLVYRMKKKDEGSYDLGKKPIYKKAPTNEFYA